MQGWLFSVAIVAVLILGFFLLRVALSELRLIRYSRRSSLSPAEKETRRIGKGTDPFLASFFLAIGKVQYAGKRLTVRTGEVLAFTGNNQSYEVVALMQATFVKVGQ